MVSALESKAKGRWFEPSCRHSLSDEEWRQKGPEWTPGVERLTNRAYIPDSSLVIVYRPGPGPHSVVQFQYQVGRRISSQKRGEKKSYSSPFYGQNFDPKPAYHTQNKHKMKRSPNVPHTKKIEKKRNNARLRALLRDKSMIT